MEWLVKALIGGALSPVINAVLGWQKQKLEAAGSHEARVAELASKEIELDRREAEINSTVVIAEQGNWVTRSIRPLLALPVIVLVWKLLVWDKALGQWTNGTTDPLSDKIWWYVTTVTIAYMGGRSVEKVADKIAGIWKK